MTTEPSSMLGQMRQKIPRARSPCKESKISTPPPRPLARLLYNTVNTYLNYNILYKTEPG